MDKELQKLIRHQRYLYEKERENGIVYYSSEKELYELNPIGVDMEQEFKEKHYKAMMEKAQRLALFDLEKINPYWYNLVCDFYLGEKIITLEQLGAMYGKSRQAVKKSLDKAMNILRELAEDYLEKLLE